MKTFFKLPKRIDPRINSFISIKNIRDIPVIIQFNKYKDKSINKKLMKAGFKSKYNLSFIDGISGEISSRNFDNLKKLIEIKKIYYDDKAILMGWISEGVYPSDINQFSLKSLTLSGKGICLAFIDSGIYPHNALNGSGRKIVAFKDLINNINSPYDDNGHGTACAGAVSGMSADRSFCAPAFESAIISAKAFHNTNYGSYSDILASMQWILDIKDKYNIKIAVLPFGTDYISKDFDIISLAAEEMWLKDIFVICPSGNKGPNFGTITSPGCNSKVFTVSAFKIENDKMIIPQFCSRGPGLQNIQKPDAIMPGYLIPSLSGNTYYYPKKNNISNYSKMDYISFSGTSAAVSQAAAAIALLYEKKGNISPDDAKSVLKLCSTSIGEVKNVQGEGFIDIKKIEDL